MNGPYAPLFAQAGQAYNVDPRLLASIAQVESSDEPNVVSPVGAQGLMQLMPATARTLGVDPNNPAQAVSGAARLLAQNMARYKNPDDAVAAYFGGTNQADWGPKTRAYVEKIAAAYKQQGMPMPAPAQAAAAAPTQNLDQQLSKWVAPSAPAAQPNAAPSAASADIDQQLGKFVTQQTTANAQPNTEQLPPIRTPAQQVADNLARGLHVVTDLPAQAIANGVGYAAHAMGFAPNWHPGQTTTANDAKAAQKWQQTYGNQRDLSWGNIADIGMQTLAGGATIGAGEGVLGAGADLAGAALKGVGAETAGTIVPKVAQYALGRGGTGIIGRTASLAVNGAGQAAAFDKLTGRPITPMSVAAGALLNPIIHGTATYGGNRLASVIAAGSPAAKLAAQKVLAAHLADGAPDIQFAPGDTLATAAGPNVQGLAENLANKPGPGRNRVLTYFDNLLASHPGVLRAAIRKATGSEGDVHDLTDQIIAQRKAISGPKFVSAFERIKPTQDEIDEVAPILHSPEGQQGLQKALTTLRRKALADKVAFDPASIGIVPKELKGDEPGNPTGLTVRPGPGGLAGLHAAKEGLDDLIEGQRDPYTRQLPNTKEFNALRGVRDTFRDTLTDMYPRYKTALDAYSGPSHVIDAVRAGRQLFSKDSEITANKVAKMSPGEKAGFQAGVARAVLDKVNSVTDGNGAPNAQGNVARIFNRPDIRQKITAAFDNPADAEKLMQSAEAINRQAQSGNKIISNSRTALRTAERQHDWHSTARDVIANALTGRGHYAVLDLLKGVLNHQRLAGNPDVEDALGNLLTNPDQSAVQKALQSAVPGRASQLIRAGGRSLTKAAPLGGQLGIPPQRAAISGGGGRGG